MNNAAFIRAHRRRQLSTFTAAGRLAGAGRIGDRRSQGEDARANASGGDSFEDAYLAKKATAPASEGVRKYADASCTVSSATAGRDRRNLPGADVSAEKVRASNASMNAAPVSSFA